MTKDRDELIKQLLDNEDDYWNLPQWGLIPDWFLRYWHLHNSILEYLDEETCPYTPTERRQ